LEQYKNGNPQRPRKRIKDWNNAEFCEMTAVEATLYAHQQTPGDDAHTPPCEVDTKKPNKKRKIVMIDSTAQVLARRTANDIIFSLRSKEDRLVGAILDQDGTDSRAIIKQLGVFAIDIAKKFNVYTQRQIAAIDRARGDNVAVSNFVARKIPQSDIDLIQVFFDTMVHNNANDHVTRVMRVAAIFVGLTMCIEFRTELTPTPVHINRFSNAMIESATGAATATQSLSSSTAAARAASATAAEKEEARRDLLRSRKVDAEALKTFLEYDAADLMSRLFDGAITLPVYAQMCVDKYLSYKPMFNPWITRKYLQATAK